MSNNREFDLLMKLIEHIGQEWESKYRPQDVRLNLENIRILRNVNTLVTGGDLDLKTIQTRCPAFIRTYREVMLRDIQEPISDGIAN